jgi:hypothetical protein
MAALTHARRADTRTCKHGERLREAHDAALHDSRCGGRVEGKHLVGLVALLLPAPRVVHRQCHAIAGAEEGARRGVAAAGAGAGAGGDARGRARCSRHAGCLIWLGYGVGHAVCSMVVWLCCEARLSSAASPRASARVQVRAAAVVVCVNQRRGTARMQCRRQTLSRTMGLSTQHASHKCSRSHDHTTQQRRCLHSFNW